MEFTQFLGHGLCAITWLKCVSDIYSLFCQGYVLSWSCETQDGPKCQSMVIFYKLVFLHTSGSSGGLTYANEQRLIFCETRPWLVFSYKRAPHSCLLPFQSFYKTSSNVQNYSYIFKQFLSSRTDRSSLSAIIFGCCVCKKNHSQVKMRSLTSQLHQTWYHFFPGCSVVKRFFLSLNIYRMNTYSIRCT